MNLMDLEMINRFMFKYIKNNQNTLLFCCVC